MLSWLELRPEQMRQLHLRLRHRCAVLPLVSNVRLAHIDDQEVPSFRRLLLELL